MNKKEIFVETQTTNMMLELGIPSNVQGFRFLRFAIMEAVKDQSLLDKMTARLYPLVGEMYDATASVVERSIRHAIEVAYNRDSLQNLNRIFGIEICNAAYKLTNGELISILSDKIARETRAKFSEDGESGADKDKPKES